MNYRGVRRGVSKGVVGQGKAGPSDTLGSRWPPLAIRSWKEIVSFLSFKTFQIDV
jgi:hypothetical protein